MVLADEPAISLPYQDRLNPKSRGCATRCAARSLFNLLTGEAAFPISRLRRPMRGREFVQLLTEAAFPISRLGRPMRGKEFVQLHTGQAAFPISRLGRPMR